MNEMAEHAWRYFDLHAKQRMSIFNFFILLVSLVGTGTAFAALQGSRSMQLVGATLGILMAAVSFVFGKLDARVSNLIKRSEKALSELEAAFGIESCRLFSSEAADAKAGPLIQSPLFRGWTFGSSFRFLFWVTAGTGIAAALLCLSRAAGWLP